MEALLPLTKIPCILLATIGLQITVTPPHPPPAKSEEAPSTTWEVVLKQRGGPVVIKASSNPERTEEVADLTCSPVVAHLLDCSISTNIVHHCTDVRARGIRGGCSECSRHARSSDARRITISFADVSPRYLPCLRRGVHPLLLLSRAGPLVYL